MNQRARHYVFFFLLVAALLALSWRHLGVSSIHTPGRIVTVGIYDNAPKVYVDQDGRPTGLFVELLHAMARQEHWSLRFVTCTWAECLQKLDDGSIDLMPDVAYSEARSKRFDFHELPVAYSWSQIYRGPKTPIHSISDLAGRRVAVLRDSIQERYLAQLMRGSGTHFTLIPVETYTEGFAAVHDGQAAAVVSNTFFGSRHARAFGLIETPIMFEPVSLYFATTKGRDARLLRRIDHYLANWRDDPDSIYFGALRRAMAPAPVTIVPQWLWMSLFSGAALVALLLGISVLLRWQVRRSTAELQQANHRLDQMLNASPVVLYRLRQEADKITAEWVSPNIRRLFGFSAKQALAPGWWERQLHPEDRDKALARFRHLTRSGTLIQEYRMLDARGQVRHIRDELRTADEIMGDAGQIVGTWSDLTESREQAAQVSFLTNHDPLTALPNRVLLREQLTRHIDQARRTGSQLAVLAIDLDRFKNVNDTLGHSTGDQLLQAAAGKLGDMIRPEDIIARVGGDDFVLVLDDDSSMHKAETVAQEILSVFANPLVVGSHQLIVTASVGISLYPADGADTDTLLKHAELALYEAKDAGRNTWRFFASELSTGVLERLNMENSLRGAAARNELVLHYQPQIDLNTGKLIGVEALVRWNHPEIGMVPPARFIPLAEETGIIKDIGAWVLLEACRQTVAWQHDGLVVPRMAVNLSVQQIEGKVLSSQVAEVLRATGLEASRLELEITESTIMRNPDNAISALRALKDQGVMLAIDDFGTGHSSLAYLKRMPFDRLKIDQSFVHDIGQNADDESITRTIIGLARSLGLETVAEGVERGDQANFLRAEGCEFAQGYLFSRPVPAAALADAAHLALQEQRQMRGAR